MVANNEIFGTVTDVYWWNRESKKFFKVNQGGTSCFYGGQLVVTDRGDIPISSINVGNVVPSYNMLTGEQENKKVIDTFKYPNKKPCLEVTLKSGEKIKATEDHRFFFNGGWVTLRGIVTLWDYGINLNRSKYSISLEDIQSVEEIPLDYVYDIEVEDNHNFYLSLNKPTLVHNSSKTVSIMQCICESLMKERLTALVTGAQHHTLESGPKNDLKDIIATSEVLRAALKNPDAEGNKLMFNNGSRLIFKAYDKPGKAKSGKRDITFINEANEISYEIAQHLYKRTRKTVYIDFNSDARFWAHEYIVEGEAARTDYFISNFTHNPYIPEETLRTLKSIYLKWKSTGSSYWENEWRVYGLGLTGSVAGTIFGHNYFHVDNFDSIIGLQKRAYAIDFGYTNDPTAIVDCGFKFGNFYGKQLLYETGHYGSNLAIKLRDELRLDMSRPVICDNDKASIMALQKVGFKALVAKKPKVEERISLMQDVDMYVDRNSFDWDFEQQHYKFKLNQLTLEYTNTPVDKHNHLFDAYGYYLVWAMGYTGGAIEKIPRIIKSR